MITGLRQTEVVMHMGHDEFAAKFSPRRAGPGAEKTGHEARTERRPPGHGQGIEFKMMIAKK